MFSLTQLECISGHVPLNSWIEGLVEKQITDSHVLTRTAADNEIRYTAVGGTGFSYLFVIML